MHAIPLKGVYLNTLCSFREHSRTNKRTGGGIRNSQKMFKFLFEEHNKIYATLDEHHGILVLLGVLKF